MKCSTCGKMNCMAHGGEVAFKNQAKEEHKRVLGESRALPKPKLKGLAKGGMPEDAPDMPDHDDSGIDDELNDMAAQELMDAFEAKDKKGVLEAIRALVMNCKG